MEEMGGAALTAQAQDFQFSRECNTFTEGHVVLCNLESRPSPLASFVLPVFRFFNVLGICPSTFKFHKDSGRFEHIKGPWMTKAISILLGILMAAQFYGMAKLSERHAQSLTIVAMLQVLGVCYVFFMLSFVRAFLFNGELFNDIFNSLQDVYKLTLQIGCEFPPIWKIRLVPSCLLICCVGIALLFTIGIAPIRVDSFSDIDFHAYFENFGNVELQMVNSVLHQGGNSTSKGLNLDGPVRVTLGVISFLVHLWGNLCWGGAICMNTLWSFMFWLMLRRFLQVVSKTSNRNTLKDIRNFNAITGLIDTYNKAYGWVILSSISTGTVHFSMNIFRIFNEKVGHANRIGIFGAFLWFGLMLTACAHVHHTAWDIVLLIKSRFQADCLWSKRHGTCVETAQGMMLVLHEIQMNSVGFKALGFFTCTYSFIGTVLSTIATYAIIVLQFQN